MTKKIEFQTDVKMVDIKSIKPYANNAKKHPKEQIEKLAKHIADIGWDQPIVVDEDNFILKGHGRLLAAKKLGLEKIPVIKKLGLTEQQKKVVRIADNKIAESEWDYSFLKDDLEFLKDLNLLDLNFTSSEIEKIFDLKEKNVDEKEINLDDLTQSKKCPKCGFEYDE